MDNNKRASKSERLSGVYAELELSCSQDRITKLESDNDNLRAQLEGARQRADEMYEQKTELERVLEASRVRTDGMTIQRSG